MSQKHTDPSAHNPQKGYDRADVSIKWVATIIIAFVVVFIVISVGTKSLFIKDKNAVVYQQQLQPVSPTLIEVRAHEDSLLDNYQILNIDKGIYQIPIDRAMEIMAGKARRGTHTQP